MRLAEFFESAGSVMFENWRAQSTPNVATKEQTDSERLVKSAIIEALSDGSLLAITFLALIAPVAQALTEGHEPKSSDENSREESRIKRRVSPNEPLTYGPTGPFYIDSCYWSEFGDQMIDWKLSQGCFPADHILVANGHALPDARPDIPKGTFYQDVIVTISDSEQSISAMYKIPPLPAEIDFDRYFRFKNRVNDEIVAIAWKYLALACHPRGSKPHKEIGAIIDIYLQKHNLPEMKDRSRANMITSIIRQWERANIYEFPFLTTGSDSPPAVLSKRKK